MTTEYEYRTYVTPDFFTLCKDGSIRVKTPFKQKIGAWGHVDNLYHGGISYTGAVTGNSQKEFRENLVKLVERKGISIIVKEN